jgi:hypothetical protein
LIGCFSFSIIRRNISQAISLLISRVMDCTPYAKFFSSITARFERVRSNHREKSKCKMPNGTDLERKMQLLRANHCARIFKWAADNFTLSRAAVLKLCHPIALPAGQTHAFTGGFG